jgi:hypothetical protein
MNQYTIFSKNKLLVALDVDEETYGDERKQLLENDFEILITKIRAESKKSAMEKAEYENEKQFSYDCIASSLVDSL